MNVETFVGEWSVSRNYYKDLAFEARSDAKATHVSLQNPNKSNYAYAAQTGSQVRAPRKLGTPSWESHSTAMSGSIFGGPPAVQSPVSKYIGGEKTHS